MAQETPTAWSANPDAEANRYAYDSASLTYDSADQTYDGVVTDNMSDKGKTPTEWSGL